MWRIPELVPLAPSAGSASASRIATVDSAGDERVRHRGPDDPRADHRHVGVGRA